MIVIIAVVSIVLLVMLINWVFFESGNDAHN